MTLLGIESYEKDIREYFEGAGSGWRVFTGKSVLITGATGLICSCVAEFFMWLNREYMAGIDILLAGRSYERMEERFRPLRGASCDTPGQGFDYRYVYFDASTGRMPETDDKHIDYIIHGASNAHPAVFSAQPVETMLANLYGTNALLQLARERHCKRFLLISSSEVYGINADAPYKETDYGYVDLASARSCYPSSKRGAEVLCAAYAEEAGVDTVIVRPGHIYGPTMTDSDSRASAQFARKALKGEDIIMKSAGTQLRSYCYVTDCASAILHVLMQGVRGEAYNISNPGSVCTVSDIAEAFAAIGGGYVRRAEPGKLEARSYNRMTNSSLDSGKLEALGWKARVSLTDGVRKTVEGLKRIEDYGQQTVSGGCKEGSGERSAVGEVM